MKTLSSMSKLHGSTNTHSGTTHSRTRNLTREEVRIYIDSFVFPHCNDASKYERITKIGQGTFGEVFKAKEKSNPNKVVAMKKILMTNEKEGFPITALREIRILQHVDHKNIIKLIEVCHGKATCSPINYQGSIIYLVFDFCEHDLAGLLSNTTVKFSLGHIKTVIKQILEALYYLHLNRILHRDLKASNIFITKTGILKLGDFGLARAISSSSNGLPQSQRYTNRVVTLWYRPPELLLGERCYGPPIDLWGAGCIMAEMWTRSPIMQGHTEQKQLILISQLCGSITPEVWPGVQSLELYNKLELPKGQTRKVKERLKPYLKDQSACDLLDKLLVLDPSKRYDATSAINHDFFWVDPLPCDLSEMLSKHTHSMFEYNAPQRRPGQIRHHHQATTTGSSSKDSADTGYQDRIF